MLQCRAVITKAWVAVATLQAARLSVMGLLAHLELTLGRCVAASALESMAIAVKYAGAADIMVSMQKQVQQLQQLQALLPAG